MNPDAWKQLAACRGMDSAIFFPEPKPGAQRVGGAPYREAAAVCARCRVIDACREASIGEYHGYWAGMSELQRREARTGWRRRTRAERREAAS